MERLLPAFSPCSLNRRKSDVTMVKVATADYSVQTMHVQLDVNIPHNGNAVVTISEIIDSISSLENLRIRA